MTPTEFWKSEKTGANYPIGWRWKFPDERRICNSPCSALLRNQELALSPLAYWEGAVEWRANTRGRPNQGPRVILELTGYAGPLRELQRENVVTACVCRA